MSSTFKTALLLGGLTALLLMIGGYFGGQGGLYLAFMMAIVMNVGEGRRSVGLEPPA